MPEIPKQKIYEWQLPNIQQLKRKAPIYLQAYLDQSGLSTEQFQIVALDAGEESACYHLFNSKVSIILKFKLTGGFEEATKLDAWRASGVPVPKVLDHGIISDLAHSGRNAQFVVLQAIIDQNLQTSPLGYRAIDANLSIAPEIGRQMGVALAKMHQSKPAHTGISTEFFKSFIANQLKTNISYLESKGINASQIANLQGITEQHSFLTNPTYIHADFGIHNILVNDQKGVQIIDPSYKPLVSDPYWDVALILFRLDISRLMHQINPSSNTVTYQYNKFSSCYKPLISAYITEQGKVFDEKRLSAYKIIALLSKMTYRENKLKKWIAQGIDDENIYQSEIEAYRQYLFQTFSILR